ncbi:MAG: glycosyltransferase family 2 protein [Eubacterium sp.]|nr:glycosyltransferase family 2 protein [Eubacterium sp.]
MEEKLLSVVLPAYNEEEMIEKAANTIADILSKEKIEYELIFVDDGSKDSTWEKICEAADRNDKVRGVSFSRNFGKESAMFAGLTEAEGDCVAVLDCDLQHPPEKLVEMYRLWEQGYEVIEGVKSSRGNESAAHGFAAKTFYRIISKSTGVDMSRASDFKLLDRKAVLVLQNLPERNAFFRALSSWVGFKTAQISYDVREREAGQSKWSTISLTKYAMSNITSFTSFPMQIVTFLGVFMLILSVILTVISLVQYFSGTAAAGFTTVITLQCFTGSVIMIALGIIGYYIAKIYNEVQGRPKYIIAKRK